MNQRGPLDGFENKQLKTTAYGMAVATLFLKDDLDLQRSLMDSRSELDERLELLKGADCSALKDRLDEAEMMHDQVRGMMELNQNSMKSLEAVIRHHGNLLGGIPLNINKAITGDEDTLKRAANIVEFHADELWIEATKLNEATAEKLVASQVKVGTRMMEPGA